MKTQKLLRYILITGLIVVFLCSSVQAPGLGVSPPSFTVPEALKGGEYECVITVSNTANDDGSYEFRATEPGSEWITYYRADDPETALTLLTIKGQSKEQVLLKIKVPNDAPNMDYTPTIYVRSIPAEAAEGEGAVAHAIVQIPVKGTIRVTGTQVLKGTVKSISTADTEIDYPVKIIVKLQNEGNVIAMPSIAVQITKDGTPIDSFVHDETGVKPGKTDTITVPWNTTGHEPGDYTASVTVSLADETLATEEVPFSILPRGTLTRKGVLESLSIEGEPVLNRVIKVIAAFENTGTIDTLAKFKGELYCNGALVEVIESEERLVEVSDIAQLIAYYKITMPGAYTIKGVVIYDGKETEPEEVSFTVLEGEGGGEREGTHGIPGFDSISTLIAFIIIIAIGGTLSRKHAKR